MSDMRVEVIVIPVTDVDRAKRFYVSSRLAPRCRLRSR